MKFDQPLEQWQKNNQAIETEVVCCCYSKFFLLASLQQSTLFPSSPTLVSC